MPNDTYDLALTWLAAPVLDDEATAPLGVCVTRLVTAGIVVGEVIVCAGTVETGTVCPEIVAKSVDSGITVGVVIVVPEIVVVTTMTLAISLAGMADPTPVPVNCGGIDKLAVFGFAPGSSEYMSPVSPPAFVYSPLNRFAFEPASPLYSPVVKEPHDPSGNA